MQLLILSLLTATLLCHSAYARTLEPLDPVRIDEISAMLPAQPTGPGKPITDRQYWTQFADPSTTKTIIAGARRILKSPLPELPDDLFLEFSRNGNRKNFETITFQRRFRLSPLVLAECLNNEGEFLPAINSLILAFCQEKTWVLPAHDKELTNFNGTTITIDLFSSNLAWQLATADYLLGEQLDPTVRGKLRQEVKRRVLDPFQEMIRGNRPTDYWLTTNNNWNSVCLSGVAGAALIHVEPQRERAEYVAAAEHYSKYFLSGFTSDGYCSEGLGYWNYGYGMYAVMATNLLSATGNKLNLFDKPGAAMAATYGRRITIINDVIPAFADCSLAARPHEPLLWLLNKTFGWNDPAYGNFKTAGTVRNLFEALIYQDSRLTPIAASSAPDIGGDEDDIRTVFEEAGVYILRPQDAATTDGLAAAFKGGSNNEHHNHNDIGSYVVVSGKVPVLLDPGKETYTRRTFSKNRYDSKLLNSYGHPVPVVAGKLQQTGKAATAKVVNESFSSSSDEVTLDMSSAYDAPGLKVLTRKFEYDRKSGGSFVVTDHVEFNAPQSFETALISIGTFHADDDGSSVSIASGGEDLNAHISASVPFSLKEDVIVEDAPVHPRRLAVKLKEPVTSATISVRLTPAGGV